MARLLYTYENTVMTTKIKMGQINAMRSSLVMSELRQVAKELQLDIICIQEPYTRKGKATYEPKTARVIGEMENTMA